MPKEGRNSSRAGPAGASSALSLGTASHDFLHAPAQKASPRVVFAVRFQPRERMLLRGFASRGSDDGDPTFSQTMTQRAYAADTT